ncbi:transposase [Neokomagataea tanensis NBRC 106556]|uniref:Transposase n=1 Tax=Neokomagataea tanensis NBRC 106556 TaxID=1223519 RepID=A0ABQ0QIG9_9PROT|nr:transposase [Neokomagataea tanensis NBRC 106556]
MILWAMRWYCHYGISYRDLETMLAERGMSVDQSTTYRSRQHYTPEMDIVLALVLEALGYYTTHAYGSVA